MYVLCRAHELVVTQVSSSHPIVFVGNENIPCANCFDRSEECVVSARRRPRTQNSQDDNSTDLSRRVRQIESVLRVSNEVSRWQHSAETVLTLQSTDPPKSPSFTDHTSSLPQYEYQHSNNPMELETTVSCEHANIGSLLHLE